MWRFAVILAVLGGCTSTPKQHFSVLIKNGTVYDGTGAEPFNADIGIHADTIAAIGDLSDATADTIIDATNLTVAPGFINMLSWADRSIILDSRSMSDIKQGVTLEVFGEGWSPGPVLRKNKQEEDSLWTSLGGYFNFLETRGITPNVASFVGATTIRIHELGFDDRNPTAEELDRMKQLVRTAMKEGAMGLGSSLIYAPADYADTEELIALASVAAEYGGMYITHLRSESDHILTAFDEAFRIAREANIATEIYHLKINHGRNWSKLDTVLQKIDSAQQSGLRITANMYPYTASATGLTARIPNWAQNGGAPQLRKRMRNPAMRRKILRDMHDGIPTKNSDPEDVMILGFRKDSLNALYKGKRLDEVARLHGKSADETVLDLVMEDKSTVPAIYFLISDENMRKQLQLPYVSIGSDAASIAAEEPYIAEGTHPRAYGTFARFLGYYVRDQKLMTMQEGIRRMTSLPANNLKLKKRGKLTTGYFADVVVFDANTFIDNATFENPHQYATGMLHVIINGELALHNGRHTLAKPGRVLRGPGWAAK